MYVVIEIFYKKSGNLLKNYLKLKIFLKFCINFITSKESTKIFYANILNTKFSYKSLFTKYIYKLKIIFYLIYPSLIHSLSGSLLMQKPENVYGYNDAYH